MTRPPDAAAVRALQDRVAFLEDRVKGLSDLLVSAFNAAGVSPPEPRRTPLRLVAAPDQRTGGDAS